MTISEFTTMLMLISGLTTLFVEGIKDMAQIKAPNVCAIIVSAVLSILVAATYALTAGVTVTITYIIMTVWLIILGALCAMVGYDKVIQLLSQIGA